MQKKPTILIIILAIAILTINLTNAVPIITDCNTNTTSLSCLSSAKLTCNITTNEGITSVQYQLNNKNYTASLNGGLYNATFKPFDVGETKIYKWQISYATNSTGSTGTNNPNINISYSCSDINPSVTNLQPQGQTYQSTNTVTINATIFDFNIAQSIKYSITLPNNQQQNLTGNNGIVTRLYDAKKNESEIINDFDNLLVQGGEFGSIYVTRADKIIKTPPTATINMITITAFASGGDLTTNPFYVNLTICETTVTNLTLNESPGADCNSPPINIKNNTLINQNYNTEEIMYFPTQDFTLNASKDYILTIAITNFTPTGGNNFIRSMAAPTTNVNYRRTWNSSLVQTFSFAPDMNFFYIKPYSVNFTNTTLAGQYNITIIANDTNGKINNTQKTSFLISCTENWQPNYGTCQINDTQIKTYTDQNACGTNTTLPGDNGTEVSCNYCSQDLEQILGICTASQTQSVSWIDNNYTTCCQVTSIASDCGIDFTPFNETTSQSCQFYTQEFNCTIDPTPVLNKKINVYCELPTENECIINLKQLQANSTFVLLQTTPEYQNPSETIINLFNRETELRSAFPTVNKLLNAYYTQKELRPNTNYMVEVICRDNSTTLTYQQLITPNFKTPDWGIQRFVWARQNLSFLIITAVLILLATLTIIYFIQKARGRP